MLILLAIVLAAVLAFYGILELEIEGIWKFFLAVIEMIIVGRILIKRYGLPNEMGLIMFKSRKGLKMIENLSKSKDLFNFFADTGGAMAYGISSFLLLKKNTKPLPFIVGMIILLFVWKLVFPFATYFLANVLDTGLFENTGGELELSAVPVFLDVLLVLGGFFFILLVSILIYGVMVVYNLSDAFLGGAEPSVEPGGTVLLPGVNLPLFEGIIALIVILIVHEGAHAVLARIGKVPILSSGVVLFGIIPIGAFVEPDEKLLEKLEQVKQTRVLIAGSTSNLFFSCVFFSLFLGAFYITENFELAGLMGDAARFVTVALGLTFSLNFIIGTVNMLPLPFFDGFRVLELNISNKNVVKGLMIITLVAFLLNFLPWFFV